MWRKGLCSFSNKVILYVEAGNKHSKTSETFIGYIVYYVAIILSIILFIKWQIIN